MSDRLRVLPFIGGKTKDFPNAAIAPLVSPVDETVVADMVDAVAPALAMGNAVVVKPSPPGAEVAVMLAEAFKKAGVPDGMFNVVTGGRDTAKALAAHPLVQAVTLTGSTAAGHDLARAAGAKKF